MCFLRDMVVEEMSCEGDGGGGRGRTKGHWVQTSRQFILKKYSKSHDVVTSCNHHHCILIF